jgi:hypothetical protein
MKAPVGSAHPTLSDRDRPPEKAVLGSVQSAGVGSSPTRIERRQLGGAIAGRRGQGITADRRGALCCFRIAPPIAPRPGRPISMRRRRLRHSPAMTPNFRASARGRVQFGLLRRFRESQPPAWNARNLSSHAVSPAVRYDFVIIDEA